MSASADTGGISNTTHGRDEASSTVGTAVEGVERSGVGGGGGRDADAERHVLGPVGSPAASRPRSPSADKGPAGKRVRASETPKMAGPLVKGYRRTIHFCTNQSCWPASAREPPRRARATGYSEAAVNRLFWHEFGFRSVDELVAEFSICRPCGISTCGARSS